MQGNSHSCRPLHVGILLFLLSLLWDVHAHASTSHNQLVQKKTARISVLEKLFDNFYAVEHGKLYRSAQLSARKCAYYIKKFQIKTIINLRGKNSTQDWWQKEKALARELGAQLFDIPMSACRFSSKHEITQLLALYDYAPKPILIHCYSGADRSGEAAALWALDQQGKNKREALRQLSFKYWHLRSRHPHKAQFINLWKGRDWLLKNYNPT